MILVGFILLGLACVLRNMSFVAFIIIIYGSREGRKFCGVQVFEILAAIGRDKIFSYLEKYFLQIYFFK